MGKIQGNYYSGAISNFLRVQGQQNLLKDIEFQGFQGLVTTVQRLQHHDDYWSYGRRTQSFLMLTIQITHNQEMGMHS